LGKILTIQYKGKELLPAKKDLVFKALFTANGDLELLASLLSCLLDLTIIADDITVTNTELPPAFKDGKLSRVDIRIKLAVGKHLNVEIQLNDEHNIEKRSIYYTSRLYTEQMKSGMDYEDICSTIAINILDFPYLPFEEYHNRYRIRNIKNNHELTDVFEINFIELPKVVKRPDNNLKELWLRFLAAEWEEELEMVVKEDPIFEKAVNKLSYVSADEQLRYELFMREKAELDYHSAMARNYSKGEVKGKLDMVRRLKESAAMPVEEIAKLSGLSVEEVEKL